MTSPFDDLEPQALWKNFAMLCRTPRCSGNEGPVREAVLAIAKERGLKARQDAVGNVVVCVPAAKGCEAWPIVVLQGHLDIVCEKNGSFEHDFTRDPIPVERDGDWIVARETTLGADNGVAVAAGLALLDDAPSRHGPLELLFTVDEERGLTGASGIGADMLKGRILLNLDSEEEDVVTVGCAGGGDTILELPLAREAIPAGFETHRLVVDGAIGGHSGCDIHHNRANALRCLGRVGDTLASACGGLRLGAVDGGSMRNAIPREASALVAFSADELPLARDVCEKATAEFAVEFGATDPELKVHLEVVDASPETLYDAKTTQRVLTILLATPTGVLAMNRDLPDAVETSTNLGVASETEGGGALRVVNCTRSSIGTALEGARQGLRSLGLALGAKVELEASYPGWIPNLSSSLLATFKGVHEAVTGKAPEVMVIHAGLECGILGEHFPGMEMISIGPTMEGVHAPGERLSIGSTQRFYSLLKATLEALGPDA
ncbi:MAG: aminoacyl-histidine dipeptidase [Deltaproteobacteria bacterium]|nr:aminoacyl-histidine dipeptidase [Deltaproteobacteria bacterium]